MVLPRPRPGSVVRLVAPRRPEARLGVPPRVDRPSAPRLEQAPTEALPQLHGDRHVLLVGDEDFDRLSGHQVLSGLGVYLNVFDLTESVPDLPSQLWGPNLVRPSKWTSIQPLVMAGEPCILTTQITTANVWALQHSRGLGDAEIAVLYPGIDVEQVADAAALEKRLRPVPSAA